MDQATRLARLSRLRIVCVVAFLVYTAAALTADMNGRVFLIDNEIVSRLLLSAIVSVGAGSAALLVLRDPWWRWFYVLVLGVYAILLLPLVFS